MVSLFVFKTSTKVRDKSYVVTFLNPPAPASLASTCTMNYLETFRKFGEDASVTSCLTVAKALLCSKFPDFGIYAASLSHPAVGMGVFESPCLAKESLRAGARALFHF